MTCDQCGGKGRIVKSKCPHCKGNKVTRHSSQISVVVERGMPDGYKVVFEREGDASPDVTPGDVNFFLRTQPHPVFTRKGDDLYVNQKIGLKAALLGFKKTLKHLDGHLVTLERTEVTQPNFVQAIPNEGMPHHSFPSEAGTLYVEYTVVLPAVLTAEQKECGFRMSSDKDRYCLSLTELISSSSLCLSSTVLGKVFAKKTAEHEEL